MDVSIDKGFDIPVIFQAVLNAILMHIYMHEWLITLLYMSKFGTIKYIYVCFSFFWHRE
jgi:hypothetical protein